MEDIKRTEFNEAANKMMRVAKIQELCNIYSASGDHTSWLHELSNLFKEIYAKLNSKEREECLKIIGELSVQCKLANVAPGTPLMNAPTRVDHQKMFLLDCRLRELADAHGFAGQEAEEGMF